MFAIKTLLKMNFLMVDKLFALITVTILSILLFYLLFFLQFLR